MGKEAKAELNAEIQAEAVDMWGRKIVKTEGGLEKETTRKNRI